MTHTLDIAGKDIEVAITDMFSDLMKNMFIIMKNHIEHFRILNY